MADTEKIEGCTERILLRADRIVADTERILAHTGKIPADTDRMAARTEKISTESCLVKELRGGELLQMERTKEGVACVFSQWRARFSNPTETASARPLIFA